VWRRNGLVERFDRRTDIGERHDRRHVARDDDPDVLTGFVAHLDGDERRSRVEPCGFAKRSRVAAVTEGDALTDGTYVMNEVVFDESGELTALQVVPFTEATAPTADPVTVPFRADSDTQVVVRTPGCRLGVITETAWRLDWPSFLTSMRDFASRVVEFSDAVRPVHDLEASGGFLDYVSIDVPSEFIRPSDCLRSFTWSPFVDAPFEESPWLLVWWAADETGSLDEVWRSSVYPAAIDIDSGVATLYFDARIQNIGE